MTETATTIGYKKSLVTFRLTPNEAIINANSPIWVRLKPHWHGNFQRLSRQNHATCTKNNLPKQNGQCNNHNGPYIFYNHGRVYHHSHRYKENGSKQILYRGHKLLYISASTVSAKIDPIIKAPNAAENPTLAATTTIPKHNASETISNVSFAIHLRERFKNVGMI